MRIHAEHDMSEAVRQGLISVPSPSIALELGHGLTTVMLRNSPQPMPPLLPAKRL